MVEPGANVTIELDLERVRAALEVLERNDIVLPDSLDGAVISIEVPRAVMSSSSECQLSEMDEAERADDVMPRGCTFLVQVASPTVSTPAELPIEQLGQAFLELMGMTPEEAARFSETLDWTTTFVLPVPRDGTNYREVQVDGVTGTLITQDFEDDDDAPGYVLLWVKEGILYALMGDGEGTDAIRFANEMR
jgi:hypothetical protein